MTTTTTRAWLEIRCKSRTCDAPGGRVLYRERVGGLLSVRRRGSGIIAIGAPVLAVCSCGWRWRNRDLAGLLDDCAAWDDGAAGGRAE